MTVVYIIIFIVALSLLIIIHELGHFSMAKAFNVYCFDFSVGFGPAIFHRKRKKGETYFSFRCIPLGGYVSMLGEDEDEDEKRELEQKKNQKEEEEKANLEALKAANEAQEEKPKTKRELRKEARKKRKEEEDNIQVPLTRSLVHKNRGIQAIIMGAGITMNMILALVLFFSYETFFPHKMLNLNEITLVEDSPAYEAGLTEDDLIVYFGHYSDGSSTFYAFDEEAMLTYSSGDTQEVKIGLDLPGSIELNKLSYDYYLSLYIVDPLLDEDGNQLVFNNYTGDYVPLDSDGNYYILDEDGNPIIIDKDGYYIGIDEEGNEVLYQANVTPLYTFTNTLEFSNLSSVSFTMYGMYITEDGYADYNGMEYLFSFDIEYDEDEVGYLPSLGLGLGTDDYYNDFKTAFTNTFTDFADSSHAVVDAIGGLFVGKGWESLTGVVGIYGQTTSILRDFGFGYFLYTWGLISVNLALLNLVPIPGLDGWNLLVLLIEGISRHKVPKKFKTVMSIIGYVIIIGLFVAILAKDIIDLVI